VETYKTKGVCSSEISFSVKNGVVYNVSFKGGCDGNLKAISNLVEGMKVEDVVQKLSGIDCEGRGASCPAQLAIALSKHK
jgi:uncharacterized protein (TIGR03905 family)